MKKNIEQLKEEIEKLKATAASQMGSLEAVRKYLRKSFLANIYYYKGIKRKDW